jgi:hypothetical protein
VIPKWPPLIRVIVTAFVPFRNSQINWEKCLRDILIVFLSNEKDKLKWLT